MRSSYDAVVVGAGLAGCAIADVLAEYVDHLLVVDRGEVGQAASGLNQGFLTLVGLEGAHLRLALEGRRLYDGLEAALRSSFGMRRGGACAYHLAEAEAEAVAPYLDRVRALGVRVEAIDGTAVRALFPPIRGDVTGGVYYAQDATFEPSLLTPALARSAQARGAEFRSNTRVTRLETDGDRVVGVCTNAGVVHADMVIVAAGLGSTELLSALGIELRLGPIRAYVLETNAIESRLGASLLGPAALAHYLSLSSLPESAASRVLTTQPFEEFVRQTVDGRLQCSGPLVKDESGATFPERVRALICAQIATTFPGLAGLRTKRAWAGVYGHTPTKDPIVGRVEGVPGLMLVAGMRLVTALAIARIVVAEFVGGVVPEYARVFTPNSANPNVRINWY